MRQPLLPVAAAGRERADARTQTQPTGGARVPKCTQAGAPQASMRLRITAVHVSRSTQDAHA